MNDTNTTIFGYTDTYASSPLSVSVPKLAYSADYALQNETAGSCQLVNTTTPVNQPETARFAIQDVNNVYAGTDLDPALFSAVKKGKSLLVSMRDTAKLTEGDNEIMYPVTCHMVIKYPVTTGIDEDDILEVALRNFALLFDGTNTAARVKELIRGSLRP